MSLAREQPSPRHGTSFIQSQHSERTTTNESAPQDTLSSPPLPPPSPMAIDSVVVDETPVPQASPSLSGLSFSRLKSKFLTLFSSDSAQNSPRPAEAHPVQESPRRAQLHQKGSGPLGPPKLSLNPSASYGQLQLNDQHPSHVEPFMTPPARHRSMASVDAGSTPRRNPLALRLRRGKTRSPTPTRLDPLYERQVTWRVKEKKQSPKAQQESPQLTGDVLDAGKNITVDKPSAPTDSNLGDNDGDDDDDDFVIVDLIPLQIQPCSALQPHAKDEPVSGIHTPSPPAPDGQTAPSEEEGKEEGRSSVVLQSPHHDGQKHSCDSVVDTSCAQTEGVSTPQTTPQLQIEAPSTPIASPGGSLRDRRARATQLRTQLSSPRQLSAVPPAGIAELAPPAEISLVPPAPQACVENSQGMQGQWQAELNAAMPNDEVEHSITSEAADTHLAHHGRSSTHPSAFKTLYCGGLQTAEILSMLQNRHQGGSPDDDTHAVHGRGELVLICRCRHSGTAPPLACDGQQESSTHSHIPDGTTRAARPLCSSCHRAVRLVDDSYGSAYDNAPVQDHEEVVTICYAESQDIWKDPSLWKVSIDSDQPSPSQHTQNEPTASIVSSIGPSHARDQPLPIPQQQQVPFSIDLSTVRSQGEVVPLKVLLHRQPSSSSIKPNITEHTDASEGLRGRTHTTRKKTAFCAHIAVHHVISQALLDFPRLYTDEGDTNAYLQQLFGEEDLIQPDSSDDSDVCMVADPETQDNTALNIAIGKESTPTGVIALLG